MSSLFDFYDLIAGSDLFDPQFYLEAEPTLPAQGLDPVLHYLEKGAAEGRDPHPRFDTAFYLRQCAERGLSVSNPLLHFLQEGRALGIPTRPRKLRTAPSERSDVTEHFNALLHSGLFDLNFYNAAYGFRFATDAAGLAHFLKKGLGKARKPNLYFEPAWYQNRHPGITDDYVNPLVHYLLLGDAEGLQPSKIFDTRWYRNKYSIPVTQNALAHYLAHKTRFRFSPLPEFDVDYYGDSQRDIRAKEIDPFEHFLTRGFREFRNPSPDFHVKFYVNRYLNGSMSANPLLHYLDHKGESDVLGAPPGNELSSARALQLFTRPSVDFETVKPIPAWVERKAKLLAFYLPQFHAFAENDRWWGEGFTEWTNVARGMSRFNGHYQPRVPRDLGFYSLDTLDTLRKQVELARGGGIHGFVYYYYWFNGKRLMEKPLEQLLAAPDIDMPFCLMWANERWTRRWDGSDNEVLIAQDYAPGDDEALVADFVRHFRDPRYIRIDGRPLLMVYRASAIPATRRTLARWRRLFKESFGEDPILVMAQSFADKDPERYGFDGAVEFPPHKLTNNLSWINDRLEYLDPEFSARVFDYDDVVAASLKEPPPSFPLIKTAVPSWDNDARLQGKGLGGVVHGSSPAKYGAWLSQLVNAAERRPFFGESIVCINAWNEWAEAAYLEPDLHYGGAYLNATGRAVTGQLRDHGAYSLLLVGHDAYTAGAQHLLLNIGRNLRQNKGLQIVFVLLGEGSLEKDYREIAETHVVSGQRALIERLTALKKRGFMTAFVNTVVAASALPDLGRIGIEAVTLVHELPRLIREKNLRSHAHHALELSRYTVFPTAGVRDQFLQDLGTEHSDRMRVLPQGAYKQGGGSQDARADIRRSLRIPAGQRLVLNVGYADLRKGFDLFLQVWRQTQQRAGAPVHFCWVGGADPALRNWLSLEIKHAQASGTFHLAGYRENADDYMQAADAFLLTSREDPFPTVVHEALGAGLPVILFEESGGMPEFLKEHRMGVAVPHGDTVAMTTALCDALESKRDRRATERRLSFVREQLDFGRYVDELLKLALPELVPVSVAVINYNYARYLRSRLRTVFQQRYPVREVLLLDDCSTDQSLEIAAQTAAQRQRAIRLVSNQINSGSVFAQWRKAAEAATGDYLWLAEADDASDSGFLDAVIEIMRQDPAICMGFSDSCAVDGDGKLLWESYKPYYAQQGPGLLTESAVFEGAAFVERHLSVCNLILNVSAVVWRRESLLSALDRCQAELQQFQMAGDWMLYLEVLLNPGARIAYIAEPLNTHRRHAESVTHSLKADVHVAEIARCQRKAASQLRLNAVRLAQQAVYLETVSAQLGAKPARNGRLRGRKPVK